MSFSAIPRVQDAIAATTQAMDSITNLGLPPALQNTQSRAQIDQRRSDLQSHALRIESAASSVADGNLAAIGHLLSDLNDDPSMDGRIVAHLREVASELGVSLASTQSCRQLVDPKL